VIEVWLVPGVAEQPAPKGLGLGGRGLGREQAGDVLVDLGLELELLP
jgi:hypothetical protein